MFYCDTCARNLQLPIQLTKISSHCSQCGLSGYCNVLTKARFNELAKSVVVKPGDTSLSL